MIETDTIKVHTLTADNLTIDGYSTDAATIGELLIGQSCGSASFYKGVKIVKNTCASLYAPSIYQPYVKLDEHSFLGDLYGRPLIASGSIVAIHSFLNSPTEVFCDGNMLHLRAELTEIKSDRLIIRDTTGIATEEAYAVLHPMSYLKDARGKVLIRDGIWVADEPEEEQAESS